MEEGIIYCLLGKGSWKYVWKWLDKDRGRDVGECE